MLYDTLNYVFWENRVQDYLIVLGAVVAGVIIIRFVKFVVVRRIVAWAKKKDTPLDADLVKSISKTLLPVLYLGTAYVALRFLTLPENVSRGVDIAGKVLFTVLGARLVIAILAGAIRHYWLPREGDVGRERTIKALMPIIKIAVWIVAAIFLLDNLGFKIATVVAGLGIGGVAVALAGQALLKDLFSYFAILFDRPFEIGDQIAVDDKMGTVEKVGVKTTRLKGLGGEQLIFSNADLTDSRVQNFKRMKRRRIAVLLGVTYDTPAAKLRKIPDLVRGIIDSIDGVDFDRAHFASFGDFSLVFEVVYFVRGNDYKKYMDIQEDINMRLYEKFAKQKIEFAYPTQTVYLPSTTRSRGKK